MSYHQLMPCYYCKNKLKAKKVTYNINRQGYDVILRDVPTFVSQECGEMFFDEKSVDKIQSLIQEVDKKAKMVREYSGNGKYQKQAIAI